MDSRSRGSCSTRSTRSLEEFADGLDVGVGVVGDDAGNTFIVGFASQRAPGEEARRTPALPLRAVGPKSRAIHAGRPREGTRHRALASSTRDTELT